MAMKLGGEYDSERIMAKHFDRFAEEAGLGKAMVKRRVKELAQAAASQLAKMPMYDPAAVGLAQLIRERCEKTLLRLSA
jgi:serine/threonine-protein kinase HipA